MPSIIFKIHIFDLYILFIYNYLTNKFPENTIINDFEKIKSSIDFFKEVQIPYYLQITITFISLFKILFY
jgi:hypothetical protein